MFEAKKYAKAYRLAHIEHKTPLSRGGNNSRENLDVACESCNHSKNNKTESEYLKWKEQYV